MAVCRCLLVLALVITMASTWALGADNPTPKPAVPSRVKVPGGLRPADGAKTDPATGLPTRVVHEASGITLVLVPAGEFRMGHGKAEHRRVIRKPFYLGETEVSVAQFRKFAEATKYQTDAERGVPDGDGRTEAVVRDHPPDADRPRDWSRGGQLEEPVPEPEGNPPPGRPPGRPRELERRDGVREALRPAAADRGRVGVRRPGGHPDHLPVGRRPGRRGGVRQPHRRSPTSAFPSHNPPFPFDDGAEVLSPVGAYKPNAWGLQGHDRQRRGVGPGHLHRKYPADGADESAATGDGAKVLRGGSWVDGPGMNRPGMLTSSRRDFIGFRVARSVE